LVVPRGSRPAQATLAILLSPSLARMRLGLVVAEQVTQAGDLWDCGYG
jgi:hypothetical protein